MKAPRLNGKGTGRDDSAADGGWKVLTGARANARDIRAWGWLRLKAKGAEDVKTLQRLPDHPAWEPASARIIGDTRPKG